jgi:hypothetical protein
MRRAPLAPALSAAALSLAACGPPLVPGDLSQAPLASLQGTIVGGDAAGLAPPRLRVTALWIDPLGERDDLPSPPDRARDTVVDARFALDLLRPPPPGAVRRVASSTDPSRTAFAFAFAEIVAFEDGDGDGSFRVGPIADGSPIVAPDLYRGVSGGDVSGSVLIYVEEPRTDPSNPIPELDAILVLPRGYHHAAVRCIRPSEPEVSPADETHPVEIEIGPAAAVLPETRVCLRARAR